MNRASPPDPGTITVPGLRAEHKLLLLCARPHIEAEGGAAIRGLVQSNFDWDALFLAASRHGLLGLVHDRLQDAGSDLVPASAHEFLNDCARRTADRNRYLTTELLRILKRFRSRQISAVPFGGPILVSAIYGDFALRESKSLSFLIPADQMAQSKQLLVEDGYRREYTWDRQRESAEWRFLRVIGLDREDGVHVWLYRELDPGCLRPPLDISSAKDFLAQFSAGGEVISSLSREDLLLHVCVEAAESALSQRLWPVADIARLLDARQEMDWDRLLERSRIHGVQRRIGSGLLLARDLLAVKIPEALEPILQDGVAQALAAQSAARMFTQGDIVPSMRSRLAMRLQSRERIRDKIRIVRNLVFTPTREDWAVLPLTPALYYVWKPIRVLGRRFRLFSSRRMAVFMPTPMEVSEEMLNVAEVGPADTVYDLGCGDGRIVILAATRHGAHGVGIDLDPDRITEAQANARKAGVEHLVRFAREDVMEVDLSSASVVSLFLSPQANLMLRPRLQAQLRQNARIVSRSHDMGDWLPQKTKLVACDGALSRIYLWRIASGAGSDRRSESGTRSTS